MTLTAPAIPAGTHRTGWRIAWTRGRGCQPLAAVLNDGQPDQLKNDLVTACVTARTDLLVARRLTSFDLVPVAVPHDIDLEQTSSVTVAVSDGPHSPLAVAVASRIAARLETPWNIVTAYSGESERHAALDRLGKFGRHHPAAGLSAVETRNAAALTEPLTETTLLVLGAGGGSWLQRQLIGPGHRLEVAAPGGTVVVRSAPRRCFHLLDDPHTGVVGAHMPVSEIRRLFARHAAVAVAQEGVLIGIIRHGRLAAAPDQAEASDVMEAPVSVTATEPLEAAQELTGFLDGGPVPVTGPGGQILGLISVSVDDPRELGDA